MKGVRVQRRAHEFGKPGLQKSANNSLQAMFVCLAIPVLNADDGASSPEWFRQHLAYLTAGDGTWLADNSSFKSDEEPYDSYEVTYIWAPANRPPPDRVVWPANKRLQRTALRAAAEPERWAD